MQPVFQGELSRAEFQIQSAPRYFALHQRDLGCVPRCPWALVLSWEKTAASPRSVLSAGMIQGQRHAGAPPEPLSLLVVSFPGALRRDVVPPALSSMSFCPFISVAGPHHRGLGSRGSRTINTGHFAPIEQTNGVKDYYEHFPAQTPSPFLLGNHCGGIPGWMGANCLIHSLH